MHYLTPTYHTQQQPNSLFKMFLKGVPQSCSPTHATAIFWILRLLIFWIENNTLNRLIFISFSGHHSHVQDATAIRSLCKTKESWRTRSAKLYHNCTINCCCCKWCVMSTCILIGNLFYISNNSLLFLYMCIVFRVLYEIKVRLWWTTVHLCIKINYHFASFHQN